MTDRHFPIVGIGASAGGVKALEGFFRGLPADTGMAFVIVMHMAPDRESALPEILERFSAIPVASAENGVAVTPGHVYVCPPGHFATVTDNRLRLAPLEPALHRFPIDLFLTSLAENSRDAAIGILLSGGGSDGTSGIRAIKEHGGLTLAQGRDGSGPQQSAMPEAAIHAGVVDLVLTTEQMGPRLAEIARSFHPADAPADAPAAADIAAADDGRTPQVLQQVSRILLKQLGHDFSGYKPRTFMRRVQRRMKVLQLADAGAYVERLRSDPEEVSLLFRDLLIGVSSFFRDSSAFEALAQQVIPRLFEGKGANDTLRIWVPGCATGEEAYSIAILLREHMDTIGTVPKVQIFATDIDEGALVFARVGRYQPSVLANVSTERLQRFFTGEEAGYTIGKDLREMCIFSSHNVLRDPPFSRLDLVSCRNLLIYFGAEFQARVLAVFHFALKPSGFLFLGAEENVSHHPDLFATLDRKQRIFQRRDQVAASLHLAPFTRHDHPDSALLEGKSEAGRVLTNLRDAVQARVMERFAPAHVVVNRDGDVLYYAAHTGKYLEAAPGLPNRQVLAMARKGLRLDLHSALREAVETRRKATRSNLAFNVDGRVQTINLVVEPFGDSEQDPLFLVLFQDVGEPVVPGAGEAAGAAGNDTAEQLEQELRQTRDRLQATIEEYETAVEELKSSNEEMQSINEELQSANEELETSREELQSVNEELSTVNAELGDKVELLDRANADLRNVYESTQLAIVFLDRQLVIRSFTPAATDIFKLISSDQGRPLTDIVNNLRENGDIGGDILTVFEHGEPIERRVHHVNGHTHYFMRVLPYRTGKAAIEGAIVVFVDVTRLVEAEMQQRRLLVELNSRVNGILGVILNFAEEAAAHDEAGVQSSESLLGRVRSMAMCYELLARADWGEVALRDILTGEFEKYRSRDSQRIFLDGPHISFKAPSVLALGMAFHELASNAANHGALSHAKGRVTVTWEVTEEMGGALRLEWREQSGERLRKARQAGFGSQIIDHEIRTTLGGAVTIDDQSSGLIANILIPLDAPLQ